MITINRVIFQGAFSQLEQCTVMNYFIIMRYCIALIAKYKLLSNIRARTTCKRIIWAIITCVDTHTITMKPIITSIATYHVTIIMPLSTHTIKNFAKSILIPNTIYMLIFTILIVTSQTLIAQACKTSIINFILFITGAKTKVFGDIFDRAVVTFFMHYITIVNFMKRSLMFISVSIWIWQNNISISLFFSSMLLSW